MDATAQNYYRKCSSCKKEIGFGKVYQVCEVTSCKKHGFCSVNCWNLHNEVMNHKSAGAIEVRAPFTPLQESDSAPRRILISPNKIEANLNDKKRTSMDDEILIVASKLKQYVKEKYDLNTSADVMEVLSSIVRKKADEASEHAIASGRKTLMNKDFLN